MKTLNTLVENIRGVANIVGATINLYNKGNDNLKELFPNYNAATKESIKDLLSANSKCTQELTEKILDVTLSVFSDSTAPKKKKESLDDYDLFSKEEEDKTKTESNTTM